MADWPETYPVKPGDWVSDGTQIAKVKAVDWDGAEYVVDLVLYSRNGDRIGRESPVMGGPRSFEPCCSWRYWHRVPEPSFPLQVRWIDREDGKRVADYNYGRKLPDLQWKRPVRKARAVRVHDDPALEALRQIAAGHNDARALAQSVLARGGRRG